MYIRQKANISNKNDNKQIEEGSTFHQETTLAGKIILKTIEKAKDNGFHVVMNDRGVNH